MKAQEALMLTCDSDQAKTATATATALPTSFISKEKKDF